METRIIQRNLAERVINDFNRIFSLGLTEEFSQEDLYHGHAIYEKPSRLEDYCLTEQEISKIIQDPSKLSILYHARELQTDHPNYSRSNILSTPDGLKVLDGGSKRRISTNDLGKWSPFQLDVVESSDGRYEIQGKKVNIEMTIHSDIKS